MNMIEDKQSFLYQVTDGSALHTCSCDFLPVHRYKIIQFLALQ